MIMKVLVGDVEFAIERLVLDDDGIRVLCMRRSGPLPDMEPTRPILMMQVDQHAMWQDIRKEDAVELDIKLKFSTPSP